MLVVTVKEASVCRSNIIHDHIMTPQECPRLQWVFNVVLEIEDELYSVNVLIGQYHSLRRWLKNSIEEDFDIVIDNPNIPTTLLWRYESSEYEDNLFTFEFVTEKTCLSNFITSEGRTLRIRCSDLRNFDWNDHECYGSLSNFPSLQNAVRQLERSVSQITILNVETTETNRRITYRSSTGQEAVLEVKRDPEDFQCFQSQWKDLTNRRVAFSGNVPTGADLEFVKHTTEALYFRVIDTDASYFSASSDGNGLLKVEYQNGLFIGDDASYWITGLLRGNGGEARAINQEAYEQAFADVQREWTYSEPLSAMLHPFKRLGDASLTPNQFRVLVDGFVVPVQRHNVANMVVLRGDGFEVSYNQMTVSRSVSDPELRSKTFELAIADK